MKVWTAHDYSNCIMKSISDAGIFVDSWDAEESPDVLFVFAFPGIPDKGLEATVRFIERNPKVVYFICAPDNAMFKRLAARGLVPPSIVKCNCYNYGYVRNRPLVIGTNFSKKNGKTLSLDSHAPSDVAITPFVRRIRLPYDLVREIIEQYFAETDYRKNGELST